MEANPSEHRTLPSCHGSDAAGLGEHSESRSVRCFSDRSRACGPKEPSMTSPALRHHRSTHHLVSLPSAPTARTIEPPRGLRARAQTGQCRAPKRSAGGSDTPTRSRRARSRTSSRRSARCPLGRLDWEVVVPGEDCLAREIGRARRDPGEAAEDQQPPVARSRRRPFADVGQVGAVGTVGGARMVISTLP